MSTGALTGLREICICRMAEARCTRIAGNKCDACMAFFMPQLCALSVEQVRIAGLLETPACVRGEEGHVLNLVAPVDFEVCK